MTNLVIVHRAFTKHARAHLYPKILQTPNAQKCICKKHTQLNDIRLETNNKLNPREPTTSQITTNCSNSGLINIK
jgi:hypothetical protein